MAKFSTPAPDSNDYIDITKLDAYRSTIWCDYIDAIEDLHHESIRNDASGRMGYVYFAQMHFREMPDTPWEERIVKIGRSVRPRARVHSFNKSPVVMPYTIMMMRYFWAEDAVATERLLHTMLQKYRTDGEWFKLPYDIWSPVYDIWYAGGKDNGIYFCDMVDGCSSAMDFFGKRVLEATREREEGMIQYQQFQAGEG